MAVFVVWSDQLGGSPDFVPSAMKLMADPRAQHFWDGNRFAGRSFQTLELDGESLELSSQAWDTYLLFDRDAVWGDDDPPRPVWWEHQLNGMPASRRLDAARFAEHAAALAARRRSAR